jgi:hypothetical protein
MQPAPLRLLLPATHKHKAADGSPPQQCHPALDTKLNVCLKVACTSLPKTREHWLVQLEMKELHGVRKSSWQLQ